MKKKYSNKWQGSKQPRKQRKFLANAPLHVKHKLLSVNLNQELRKKYNKRNFPVRKGDKIKILRGEFKGKSGKIEKVNLKKGKVNISKINKTKKDGTKLPVHLDTSNLQIQELNLDDKKRLISLKNKIGEENVPKKK